MYKEFKNKKILIVGYSLTGIAAAKFFSKHGAKVYITELSEKKDRDISEIEKLGVKVEFRGHSDEFINGAYLAILSPSIPPTAPILSKLRSLKIDYMSDIEFCFRFNPDKMLVITGTNGKTTTTMLANHILEAKYKTKTCGNIGVSPFDYLDLNLDYFVCEASSYQLEYSDELTPHMAAFTNLTPDHIGFHGNIDNYFNAKAKIFKNMDKECTAILNLDDKRLEKLGGELDCNVLYFSTKKDADICLKNNFVCFKGEEIINVEDIPLCGEHNVQNVMCALGFAKILNVSNADIKKRIMSFKAPEHRCEFVKTIGKTSFYNDSKATNPEASIVALSAFPNKKVALIAGGRDKNTSLDDFCLCIKKYIKDVILIGEAADRFEEALLSFNYNNIKRAKTLEEAIDVAQNTNNDVVLLSPACASFDMFKSYEHRGEVFKDYVLKKN